jgi:hypothetical protein
MSPAIIFWPPPCFTWLVGFVRRRLLSGAFGFTRRPERRYSIVAAGPDLIRVIPSPFSLASFAFCAPSGAWQPVQRKRWDRSFATKVSRTLSVRACRMTSSGRLGRASSEGASFGASRSLGSAAQASIQAAKASSSCRRTFCWMRAAPSFSTRRMKRRIFDSEGFSRPISPWSRSERKVYSWEGRM